MWHLLYNALLLMISPAILLVLLAKQRCRRGLPQRLGLTEGSSGLFGSSRLSGLFGFLERNKPDQPNTPNQPSQPNQPVIWIHAVSLGEVVAVTPLVKELHRRHPTSQVIVSTVTETGREAVEQRLAGVATHCYAPLDFPWAVSRAIARINPSLYVFVETELWPNLLRQLHRRGVPTVMVNGRLSSRSFARQQWGPIRSFYRAMLRTISLCLMQSERDVERILMLGADASTVQRTGNIKFDQPVPTESTVTRTGIGLSSDERVIVAGSTHAGEEEALVEAYRTVVAQYPEAVLMLAPRHIERAGEVEAMVRAKGVPPQRRTDIAQGGTASAVGPRVIILDSRGELATLYGEAVVAYVGGSLVPVGGHNLLEPAAWGKPVLFGPYTDHCAEIADLLIQAGGGRRVTKQDLATQLLELFRHVEARAQMGRSARRVLEQNQGALQRTVDAVDYLLRRTLAADGASTAGHPLPLMAGR